MGYKDLGNNWNRKWLDDIKAMLKEIYDGKFLPPNSIGKDEISIGSIDDDLIKENSLKGDKLQNKTIKSDKIGDLEIKENNIDNNSISLDKIKENSIGNFAILNSIVSKNKLTNSFLELKPSKNLFDKSKLLRGFYFNADRGLLIETIHASACLIDVSELRGKTLIQNYKNTHILYDKDFNVLDSHATNPIIKIPENAEFLGITVFNGQDDLYQIEVGTATTSYEKFNGVFNTEVIKDKSIEVRKLEDEVAILKPGKNLFDKENVTKGYYVSFETGEIRPIKSHGFSDWIEVEENQSYYKNDTQQVAFYTDKGHEFFHSGIATTNIITVPPRVKYMLVTFPLDFIDELQIEKGSEFTGYEIFKLSVTEKMLSNEVQQKLESNNKKPNFEITIPNNFFALVGEQLSLYWRNVIKNSEVFEKGNYSIRLMENKNSKYVSFGEVLGNQWCVTPDKAEQKKLEIRIFDNLTGEVVCSKSFNLIIKDKISTKQAKTIVTIGDSFTDGYGISKYMHDFVTKDSNKTLNMIGLNATDKTGVKDDAWSGWGYKSFCTLDRGYLRSDRPLSDAYWETGWGENEANGWKTGQTFSDLSAEQRKHGFTKNQFWNPTTKQFDFSYYMSTYMNNQKIDGFVSLLGLNDSIWRSPDILKSQLPEFKSRIDLIINSVKKYDSSIKIFLGLVTPQQQNDSFMNTYGNEWLTSGKAKVSQEIWNKFIVDTYDNRTNENIYVMNNHASFNADYGVLEDSYNKVKFLPEITETFARDVHPSPTGARQIADVVNNYISSVLY